MSDPVHRPSHYTSGSIECIDAIDAAVAHLSGSDAFLTAQCIKYLWRWKIKHKDSIIDLLKCRWYLDRLIDQVKERQDAEENLQG